MLLKVPYNVHCPYAHTPVGSCCHARCCRAQWNGSKVKLTCWHEHQASEPREKHPTGTLNAARCLSLYLLILCLVCLLSRPQPSYWNKGIKIFQRLRWRTAWGEMTLLGLAAASPTAGWMILSKPWSRTLMSAQTREDSVRNVSVMKPNRRLKMMKFIWYWHCCLFCESLWMSQSGRTLSNNHHHHW